MSTRRRNSAVNTGMIVLAVFSASLLFLYAQGASFGESPPDGLSREETLRLGERMYRDGMLPSGEPMMAVVQGDIPVEGTMFTCASCHLRSGLGSVEGTVITPPTNGRKLYAARPKSGRGGKDRERLPRWFHIADKRPAYTDESLERVLAAGIDPAGHILDHIMPRYLLSEQDMKIMVFYLKNLSNEFSPGVTSETITFATVVAGDVSPADRESMVAPLRAYLRDRSMRAQYYKARTKTGAFAETMDISARRLDLEVWELRGNPSTWFDQLDAHYARKPVFALIGGISRSAWEPVHRFCEVRGIPCILPVTEFPVVSGSDWYTLYYSKGLYQEAEAVSRYLRGAAQLPPDTTIVQIFRDDARGRVLSEALKSSQQELGRALPVNRELREGEHTDRNFWKAITKQHPGAVFVLWLGSEALPGLGDLARLEQKPLHLFFSATLAGDNLHLLPDAARSFTYFTYPHRISGEAAKQEKAVKLWLTTRKIPVMNLEVQAKSYFLGWLLTDILMMMGTDYYRDYFLDVIDMGKDQDYMVAAYPRLSFGQGQRYASKGCYIVQITPGPNPVISPKSDWVVH